MVEIVGEIDENGHAQGEMDSGESVRMMMILTLHMLKKYGEQKLTLKEIQKIERDWDKDKLAIDVNVDMRTKALTAKVTVK